jgi:transcriptional regulator with XRE-family HTH domain
MRTPENYIARPRRPAKRRGRLAKGADRLTTRSPGESQDAIEAGRLQIGARLKHARILAGVLMRELAAKVDCTESMISKIESGRVMPSLPMLQRIVDALGRDLPSFLGSDPSSPGVIQRRGQRAVTTTDPIQGHGVSYERLVPFGAGNLLEGNVHVIEPHGSKRDPITHQGETLGFILEGQLELTIETTTYQLNEGDSFFFKNHLTNGYRNLSSGIARILWVNTPQVH